MRHLMFVDMMCVYGACAYVWIVDTADDDDDGKTINSPDFYSCVQLYTRLDN